MFGWHPGWPGAFKYGKINLQVVAIYSLTYFTLVSYYKRKVRVLNRAHPGDEMEEKEVAAYPGGKIEEEAAAAHPGGKIEEEAASAQPGDEIEEEAASAQPGDEIEEEAATAQP